MQGSSDETANSVEEGSSSGRSEGSSNEAASSRASQSAGSPGSELQSDDMADSEALKEEEEDEEEEEEDDEDDEEEVNRNFAETQKEQMREQTESRKRKAGEALGEGVGPSGSGGVVKTKPLPFNAETSGVTVTTSLEGRMRMLEPCPASTSGRGEGAEAQQTAPELGPSQLGQGPQEPTCLPRPGDFLGDAMSSEIFNCRRFIGPQHHHHHHHHHHEG